MVPAERREEVKDDTHTFDTKCDVDDRVFWLVWSQAALSTKWDTLEAAVSHAKRQASECPHNRFYILRAVSFHESLGVRDVKLKGGTP
ncbi:MAG: hypothetical protein LLG08_00575 [Actinomycetia bacterium]|nr:hypothetical protein [Actinomycetes bacterium]